MNDEDVLQKIARHYLVKLKRKLAKYDLKGIIEMLISANESGACKTTREDVDMLAQAFDDDKIKYDKIAEYVEYPFRKLYENGIIGKKIRKMKDKEHYSKVDAELFKNKIRQNNNDKDDDD